LALVPVRVSGSPVRRVIVLALVVASWFLWWQNHQDNAHYEQWVASCQADGGYVTGNVCHLP
jgi:hypothetical protein